MGQGGKSSDAEVLIVIRGSRAQSTKSSPNELPFRGANLYTHLFNRRDPSLIHLKPIAYESIESGFVRDDRFLRCIGGRKHRRFITHFIRKSIFE